MLKYFGKPAITFSEFPDEISVCVNISSCPCHCDGCCEPELLEDIGEVLDENEISAIIADHPGITLFAFMGGDIDHSEIARLTDYIHDNYQVKVGMYSGRNFLDLDLLERLDYYKIGEFRNFKGDENTWKNQTAGPICLPTSNQVMFKRVEKKWINITDKFRTKPINDWKKTIIS